ncbi:AMP-binding protein [Lutibacter sp. A64]|uniref:AMP-binding protein n=1 Tax=Lutibacter sp. A64 TaxID=2918526 RepID=UPI001F06C451|nr:AMP-binding protein [Lutibacter sp. A64]UMB53881.1 AMP-binding protein [Lutibacter sp. A64]
MSEQHSHKSFKLQDTSFNSIEALLDFSKSISIEVYSFFKEWFNKSSYVEVKTSGSTGTPKVIQLQKNYMINSAKATGNFFDLEENTEALLCMSPNYIAGKMMLVRALILGWHIDVVIPSSNPLKSIEKVYDFSAMVPLQLNNSLDEIYKIKKLIVGGGVVSNELLVKIQLIKTEVFATYGMTETITHIAVKKLNNLNKISNPVEKSHHNTLPKNTIVDETEKGEKLGPTELVSTSFYNTLPNIKISTDKRGCLVINAPKVSDEIIVTNDLVELISENSFKWLGRFDTVINSGGIKLIPEQLEEKLTEIISEPFFLAGLEDAVLGEKLVVVVASKSLKVEKLKSSLFKKIKALKTLSKYEIPKEIYLVENFVKTPTGKINRPATLKLLEK